jgi:Rrf2 family protein
MKLSHTSEYALRILSYMTREPDSVFSAKQLIDALKISDKYLRRLMTQLTKAGFITSTQGRDGGYAFSKPVDQISLAEIIDTVEGTDKYLGCALGFEHCTDEHPCVLHPIWLPIRNEFERIIKTTTLKDLDFKHITQY